MAGPLAVNRKKKLFWLYKAERVDHTSNIRWTVKSEYEDRRAGHNKVRVSKPEAGNMLRL